MIKLSSSSELTGYRFVSQAVACGAASELDPHQPGSPGYVALLPAAQLPADSTKLRACNFDSPNHFNHLRTINEYLQIPADCCRKI